MSSGSPSIGDKVVVVTNVFCRYEGLFRSVDKTTATFTLSRVRSYGTEDRDAPRKYAASARLYESVEFKAADVKEFILVDSQELADPAVVSAREHKDVEENELKELPSLGGHRPCDIESSPSSHFGSGLTRSGLRARPYNSKLCPGGPSENELGHGDHGSLYHSSGQYELQGGNGFNGLRGHYNQRNDWRSINPRSEGSFPQKHPGVQPHPEDDFNFEQGIEEFSRLKLKSPAGEGQSDEFNSDGEECAKEKDCDSVNTSQVYNKEKSFFDNLTGSAGFDPRRQQDRLRIARPRGTQGSRPYNPNVETFGEETVKQLYEIRKYAPDQRSLVRSAGYKNWNSGGSSGFRSTRSGSFGSRTSFGSRRQWFGNSAFV